MDSQPELGKVQTVIRKRPSRRHRRNRLFRRLLVSVSFVMGLCLAAVALLRLSPSLSRASRPEPTRQAAEASRNLFLETQQEALRAIQDRPVYPYSVVPGGVNDAGELKWAAEHDPLVAAHYAGFDYDHARVVRLVLARTAYVSYRIGNKIYWTRRRITLKKGETVITDGKIMARTRCANRVEEVPQFAISSSEPPVLKFDEPVRPVLGTAIEDPPVPYQSSLLNRPAVAGLGPEPPLTSYDPFGNGTWVPIAPPPLPGVCGPVKKKPGSGRAIAIGDAKKKPPVGPCDTGGGGGSEVPEPGTWLLMAAGLALMAWIARRQFVRS